MLGTNSSYSSSSSLCSSFGSSLDSFDDLPVKSSNNNDYCSVKFMCSYGGRILPRYPDGKLRYAGGHTRVLAVDRFLPFSELQAKMGELCGWGPTVSLRCQLPTEDLDALVSITSDEDLANLIEEYHLAAGKETLNGTLKIRAFLHPAPCPPKDMGKYSSARPPVIPAAGASSRFSGRSATCYRGKANPGGHSNTKYLVHHGYYWQ